MSLKPYALAKVKLSDPKYGDTADSTFATVVLAVNIFHQFKELMELHNA